MDSLDSEEAQTLAQEMEARAVYLLSLREHGRKELGYKLSQKFPLSEDYPGLVDIVLDKCEEHRWLSDERYVEAYVRQAMEKQQGPYKIKQALQMRTDRQDLVEAYLAMDDSDWADIATLALERKYGDTAKPSQAKEQARRMRFLQSRGFSQSQIWKAFRHA
ncbi:RecX family transcriptional regulator [Thiomicrospira sp. XS5]|uniref:regulatory protein RecX n=1 Tax=Thiomicrospira sp. XS5 TaxID=1775636 RepID=UPI000747E303|nr:regulatory protein RecX [Thiomicrospira sp. XS5]KUJ75818.1 RecX family transcriptional regulator [Thiomicrospira sp. XS5]